MPSVLKFYRRPSPTDSHGEGNKFPVAWLMTKRFFIDLPSEGVSELTFSIYANLQLIYDIMRIRLVSHADMVFCHQNDAWLYGCVKGKVKQCYTSKYGFSHAG